MDEKSHFALRASQKAIFWVAGLLAIGLFLQQPNVADAVLAFCFAGEVPGTSMVLAPNTVIWLATVVLSVYYMLLLRKPVLRTLKRRNTPDSSALAATWSKLQQSIATPPLVVVSSSPEIQDSSKPTSWSRVRTSTSHAFEQIRHFVGRGTRVGGGVAQGLWQRLAAVSILVYHFALNVLHEVWQLTHREVLSAWRWLVPYLWQLDGWLALQTHRWTDWVIKKVRTYDSAAFLLSLGREYKKMLAKFHPAALWADAKRDFNECKVKGAAFYYALKKLLLS